MHEKDINNEYIKDDAKNKAEQAPRKGERSAIEFINDLADKAMNFTSDKLDKIEEKLS